MNQNTVLGNQGISPQPPPNMKNNPCINPLACNISEMNDLMKYRMAYPEIYYKCQPFIMMACDQIDAFTCEMPTQEMIEKMSDTIYDDICRMYPDMAEYVRCTEPKINADPPPIPLIFDPDRERDMSGRRFRRRGLFRDFLDVLLFSELFRRRRRFF